ncbi:MAG: hypothetical protein GX552_15970 [Chloroflexi bacterium]|jgi:uncharacterized membrane protein|nr:hypothetical protein [Chloroflexota bacterium]
MARTVVALYDDKSNAQRAVQELLDSGFDREGISVLTRRMKEGHNMPTGNEAIEGAGIGAAIGLVFGGLDGLLVGLGALTVPGIGPIVAAGPLIAALTGAGVGAGVGAIVGALANLGVTEEEARVYAEGVRRGGTLVLAQTSDQMVTQAANIMDRHNPADMEQRATEWRSGGWTGLEADGQPPERKGEEVQTPVVGRDVRHPTS